MKSTRPSDKRKPFSPPRKSQSRLGALASSIAFGAGIGLLCFFALIFIFSAVCLALDDPHSPTLTLGIIAIYISALFSGFAAVRFNHRKETIVCGAISGALLALILCLILLLAPKAEPTGSALGTFICRALIIPAAIFGAFLGSREKKAKRRKRF